MSERAEVNPATLMAELHEAAVALDEANERLRQVTREYEGWHTNDLGVKVLWEALIEEEATAIYDQYEEKGERPPPEKVRYQRSVATVKKEHPELYVKYHRLRTEINALQKWMAGKRESISARQSILSTEKELMKGTSGPQTQWSGNRG
jgi:hypothetical protein